MMTKRTILLLLFTLFFTACVERGYTPKPINKTFSQPIAHKSAQPTVLPKTTPVTSSTHLVEKAEKNIIVKEKEIVKKPVLIHKTTKVIVEKEFNIFSLTEETKNKISGFFILIIGIIILL